MEFNNVDFSRFDFTGMDLRFAKFYYCLFHGTTFTQANLAESKLINSSFRQVSFKNANLTRSILRKSAFLNIDLGGARLDRSDLRESTWADIVDPPFPIYNFSLGKHLAVATPEYLAIGCEQESWYTWLRRFGDIGREHEYTDEEIERYGKVIKLYAKLLGKDKE